MRNPFTEAVQRTYTTADTAAPATAAGKLRARIAAARDRQTAGAFVPAAARAHSRARQRSNDTLRRKSNRNQARRQVQLQQKAFTTVQVARAAAGEIGTPALQANVRRHLEEAAP